MKKLFVTFQIIFCSMTTLSAAADSDFGNLPVKLTPQIEERIFCSIAAAVEYQIPADLLLAVAEIEGGKPGQLVKNTNGTYDIGVMQFNSAYVQRDLSQYGITPEDVNCEGCYPYYLAAWRIKGHLENDRGDIWTRVANYHSRTPKYNQIYRAKLIDKAEQWSVWLRTYFECNVVYEN